jgi:HEAT repeat protein
LGVEVNDVAMNRLNKTLNESGLFVVYSSGDIGFLCSIWRDYLAASYLSQSTERDTAGDYFDDPNWSEVLKFLAGMTGAVPLLKQLHQQDRRLQEDDLFVLAEWLPEAPDSHQWRRQVLIGLGQMALNQGNPIAWRQRAAVTLAKTGENGVTELLNKLVNQPEPEMRETAITSMARISPGEAVALAERMLGDAEEGVRTAAVHSLAWIDDPATEGLLIAALLNPDESVRESAAMGLALNSTNKAREILSEAVSDRQIGVRLAAVRGLSLVDEEWANKLLEEVVNIEKQPLVKQTAESVLQANRDGAPEELWQAFQAGEQEWLIDLAVNRGDIVPVGPAAIPMIMDALTDEDETIRAAAARTLGSLSEKTAIAPLERLLTDPSSEVRASAEHSLTLIRRAWGSLSIPT